MVASFNPDDPSAIVVQDLKGERFFGVPLVPDVPAVADSETLSLAAKEAAGFSRVAKARYSELATKYLPKGRPVIVDAQARETARHREAAMVNGRAQYKRGLVPGPSGSAASDRFLVEALDEQSPSDVGVGDSIREVRNFLGGEP
jgi:hypothetical protein